MLRFLARFRVASYSYNVYTNMCLRVRASSYQKVYVPPFTYIFAYTLYIHVHACVFDTAAWTTGSTLDLNLVRFMREACADLGRTFLSLAGLVYNYCILLLGYCLPGGT